jgi:hypothetical protein
MSKTLLPLVLSISCLSAFSQQDSLLKNFKYRIDHYQAFNFNIGGSGVFNNRDTGFHNEKSHSSGFSFGGDYYSVKSTDRILLTTTLNFTSSLGTGRTKYTGVDNKNTNLYASPNVTVLNKWFTKKVFAELGADISSYGYTSKNNDDANQGYSKYKQGQYSVAINTGIGTGRLENITDMQNALWLSKALADVNSLSRLLSAGELNELGRTITRANNTRVLDARKRTQFILETVDNYLQQKGLINKTDIRYFSNLNDILFFAFNSPRLSGTETFIRFKPGMSAYSSNQTPFGNAAKYDHSINTKSLVLSTGLNKYTPQNLIHQNNYGASILLSYNSFDATDKYTSTGTTPTETKNNLILKQAGVNMFCEHIIYPNTRTNITFNLQAQAGYQELEKDSKLYGNVSFNGTANYFISYRTRLTCSVGAAYVKNMYNLSQILTLIPNNILLSANAGLNISL